MYRYVNCFVFVWVCGHVIAQILGTAWDKLILVVEMIVLLIIEKILFISNTNMSLTAIL